MANFFKFVLCFVPINVFCYVHADERDLEEALKDERVQKGLSAIVSARDQNANFLVKIGGIISPSGEEQERAEAVAEEMRKIGLSDVRVNEAPNVIGRIKGRSGKALIFVSTLDDLKTVAENQRASGKMPIVDGDRVVGPGTNTSLTSVALLSAAKALIDNGFAPEHDIIFAGVSQEETGLKGMKHLYAEYKDRAVAFVDVLGEGRTIS